MSGEKRAVLVNNEVYHTYNRSVGNIEIFTGKRDCNRALTLFDYYRFTQEVSYSRVKYLPKDVRNEYLSRSDKKSLVEILAYALMPNHFHLLLKQKRDSGIRIFMSNVQNGFAKYFNKAHERDGSLFQKPFKSRRIETDEDLLHVSRYIHLNPVTSYLVKYENYKSYPWTSYLTYLGVDTKHKMVEANLILDLIGTKHEAPTDLRSRFSARGDKYEKFASDQANYQKKLHFMKKYMFD